MSPTFADLGVPASIVDVLDARGITDPFPIQVDTIEHGLDGRDVCGKAPTGSGKTLAFGIPLVVDLTPGTKKRPRALVLAPTRELADQIADELSMLGAPLGVSVLTVYGGVGYGKQRSRLAKGVDIVVACPGRLEDLLGEGALRLDDVERVVLDEADRMADMGFIPAVRRILDACSPKRQTLLFSATLDGTVADLQRRYQRDAVSCTVDDASLEPDLEHLVRPVTREKRISTTAQLIAHHGPTIVFCRTKRGADRLARQLAKFGVKAAAIHGDRSQNQRTRALDDFTAGKAQALVATDVAARGIHVDDVACVIHYDPPGDDATYVHRSGRTGRAGNTGVVVSLILDSAQRKEAAKRFAALGVKPQVDEGPLPAGPPRQHTGRTQSGGSRRDDHERGDHARGDQRRDGQERGSRQQHQPKHASKQRGAKHSPRQGAPSTHAPARGGDVLEGSVKFFDPRRGFGFILHDDRDLFVHKSHVQGRIKQGETVRFELGEGPRGVEAQKVAALR